MCKNVSILCVCVERVGATQGQNTEETRQRWQGTELVAVSNDSVFVEDKCLSEKRLGVDM